MPIGHFQKRINFNRRRANVLARIAARRHFRAAQVAKRALVVKAKGHHVRAQHLLKRALGLKAQATRAGVRSKMHRARIPRLRQARLLHAQKHGSR
jgi:hypothetical protein